MGPENICVINPYSLHEVITTADDMPVTLVYK